MQLLTVIVPTYNEEVNLPKCLKSISKLDASIFIVDSGSSDKTTEIAKAFGATVVDGLWNSFSEKLNWSIDNLPIETPWVMRVDADEHLTDDLIDEIGITLPHVLSEVTAFEIKRRMAFLGRWIRHGGIYPSWQVRLWRTGKARFEMRNLDEHMLIEGKVGRLTNDFVDENLKSLATWIDKHNVYSDREKEEILQCGTGNWGNLQGQARIKRILKEGVYYRFPLFLRPILYWIWRYFFRLGFLDGRPGLIYHFLQGFWYRFLIDAKIFERHLSKEKKTCTGE